MATKKVVMIVEDEVDLVDMLKFQFMAQGYHVVVAYNGAEGLGKLNNVKPDIIILDLNMPKLGGVEFCQRIQTPDRKFKYPVLILTARANTESIFKDYPVDGFMIKPFKIEQLLLEVERILKGKEQT